MVDDEAMDFCQGDSAMMVQYSDQVTILRDRNISRVVGKVGYDVVPGNASPVRGWSIGMNSHSKERRRRHQFIKWAASGRMSVVKRRIGDGSFRIRAFATVRNYRTCIHGARRRSRSFKMRKALCAEYGGWQVISENVFEKIVGSTVNEAITKNARQKKRLTG